MENKETSYRQIVKSAGIFGGSQVVNILVGMIRNKVIALLLGASGVGLIGIYQSIVDLLRSVGGMGMETTGVREVASSIASKERSYVVYYVHRLIQYTAILGGIICLTLCFPISFWAFGDFSHSIYIAFLSIVVFLSTLTQGQLVIFQGLRQIRTMANVLVLGSVFSLFLTIPIYYLWGMTGIIPALIITSGGSYLLSLKYYILLEKTFDPIPKKPDFFEILRRGKSMFHMGGYLVLSAVINTSTMFLIRVFYTQRMGIESAGLFQAVWAITNIYLMLVLKSMGTDFYPRLSAVVSKRVASVKLINEQTFISVLIATPIIVGMLLFGFIVLMLLYSSKFLLAESLLQWQILGTFFKVLSWPMAFILLAMNKGKQFIVCELLFYIILYVGNYLLFPNFGLDAAGIAYLAAYLIYFILIYCLAIRLIQFRCFKKILRSIFINSGFVLTAFLLTTHISGIMFYISSCLLFLLSLCYSTTELNKVVPLKDAFHSIIRRKSR